jgi:hypothetical protein
MNIAAVLTPAERYLVILRPRQIGQVVGATTAALAAMVVFNPFHLTNLTHTLVISVSKHAQRWRQVYEWRPAFDWSNPVGTGKPFLLLCILALIVLCGWLVAQVLVRRTASRAAAKPDGNDSRGWPRLDLPLMVVAGLTIYMAIRSRRFIPIAAFAACPLLAVLLDQTARSVSTAVNLRRHQRLQVLPLPNLLIKVLVLIATIFVVGFGIWLGARYNTVYLNPWPEDPVHRSIFMRMTHSFRKPFQACRFIRDNQIRGKMMNYWTEGSAIAYLQDPDPETGKTPLQLFMDGRAQAAYDRQIFDLWWSIWYGGPVGRKGLVQRRRLSADELARMGRWIDTMLKKRQVWVVLVPRSQWRSNIFRGLRNHPNWCTVFVDNQQELLVDVSTEQGLSLFKGILPEKTVYPDEFIKDYNFAYHLLVYGADPTSKRLGLGYAIKAFQSNPSPGPMIRIVHEAARYKELKNQIVAFCTRYVERFAANKVEYGRRDGYRLKLEAARMACKYLRDVKAGPKDGGVYGDRYNQYHSELQRLKTRTRW